MLKALLSALIFLFPLASNTKVASNSLCDRNPIYHQIIKNNPKINKRYALELSNKLHSISFKYRINPKKYAAILAQESMYILGAKNCKGGICVDFGIAQINKNTASAYGFDINKLTSDLEYSLVAGAIVLSDMKKMYSSKEIDWWTRYNSSNYTKRKKYQTLVARYL